MLQFRLTHGGGASGKTLCEFAADCGAGDVGITATIPKPVRLNMVPDVIARNAVQAVVKHRLDDITNLFIVRTMQRLERQLIAGR